MSPHHFQPVNLNAKLRVGPDERSLDRLCAAMLFPTDSVKQIQYFRSIEFNGPIGSTDGVTPVFAEPILEGINNGVLAGTCLMYFDFLRREHQEPIKTKANNDLEASQRVVFYLCQKYNLGRGKKTDRDKDSFKYPEITIPHARDVWKRYQRVSHLWAAYIILKGLPVHPHPADEVLQDIDLSVLMVLARQYERFIVEYFDGQKFGKVLREQIEPFRARYFDWNSDDVLAFEIPIPKNITMWLSDAAKGYVADF